MGYNTTLFICNDAFAAIDADPVGWWTETKKHIDRARRGQPVNYGFRHWVNQFWVVSNQHADNHVVAAMGGNYVTLLDVQREREGHHRPVIIERIVRRLAKNLGFRLVKLTDDQLQELLAETRTGGNLQLREGKDAADIEAWTTHLEGVLNRKVE